MNFETKRFNWTIQTFEQLTVAELYDILNLRTEVFVIEQDCIYQDMDYSDQKALHLLGKDGDKLVAYARIFDANIKYKEASIGRVVTHPSFRSIGLGKILMQQALSYCKENFPKQNIRISAQCYLERFYQNLGFEIVSAIYKEDGIDHQEMLFKV